MNVVVSFHMFSEALQIASFLHKSDKKQTTRFAGHLEIGTELKIPCKIFTKVCILYMYIIPDSIQFIYTVKPVYSGHPRNITMWPLYRGGLIMQSP